MLIKGVGGGGGGGGGWQVKSEDRPFLVPIHRTDKDGDWYIYL